MVKENKMKITQIQLFSLGTLGCLAVVLGCGGGATENIQSIGASPTASPRPVIVPTPVPVFIPTPSPSPFPLLNPTPTPGVVFAPSVPPTTPLPTLTLAQLRVVPQQVVVQGKTLVAEGYIWVDRIPSTSPPNDAVMATLSLVTTDGSPVPSGLTVVRLSVGHGEDFWTSLFVDRHSDSLSAQGTIRGGPSWAIGSSADIVADFYDNAGQRYQLRAPTTTVVVTY